MTVLEVSMQVFLHTHRGKLDKELSYWYMFDLLPQIPNSGAISVFWTPLMCNLDEYETIPLSSRRPHAEPIGCPRKNKTSFIFWMHLQQLLYLYRHCHSNNICSQCPLGLHIHDWYTIEWHSLPEQIAQCKTALPLVLQAGPHDWETECKAAHRHPSLVQQLQMKYWYQLLSDRSSKAKHKHFYIQLHYCI